MSSIAPLVAALPSDPARDSVLDKDIMALPLFAGMESELLHGLAASARLARHEKGKVFLEQGQPVTRFFIVMEGWCGASKVNPEGQESILQIFSYGDFLPEPENLSRPETSLHNFQALTPIRILMLSPTIVRNTLERSSVFAANMLAASVERCHKLRAHIEQLTLHSAEQRLGRFLLQMRLMRGSSSKEIDLPFDKSHLAAYLSIKPETLSRKLKAFQDKGFVVERNHLLIPSHDALCAYCDQLAAEACHMAHTSDCHLPPTDGADNA